MKSFVEFMNEYVASLEELAAKNVYPIAKGEKYKFLHDSELTSYMSSKGYLPADYVGNVDTKKRFGNGRISNIELYTLNSTDRSLVSSVSLKPNEVVLRSVTRSMMAGGILSFLIVNPIEGYVRFKKDSDFGDETVKFEGRKYKVKYLNILMTILAGMGVV